MVLITRVVGIVVFDEFLTQRSIGGFCNPLCWNGKLYKTKTESVMINGNGLKICVAYHNVMCPNQQYTGWRIV